jgi:SAM-dependent methyltransferase
VKKRGAYRDDLAYVHDAGFGALARESAAWLIKMLRERGIDTGTVVDLGCGSGILAQSVTKAGYEVVGFDISAAMVALARKRVPAATFHNASFLDAEWPPSVAVTAIGEVFNYLFDPANSRRRLADVFWRVRASLTPRGLFLFDVATPGRVPDGHRRGFTVGPDWACLFEAKEDCECHELTRDITTFRKVGHLYRKDNEVHRLRLYDRRELIELLRSIGFRVRAVRSYGETRFPLGYVGLLASKP